MVVLLVPHLKAATLNTSFATSPPTDSTGTTTLTTQNISTQTASTNSYGVTTSTAFDGGNSYSRVTTNLSIDKSEPFTIDFIAKFVQSGSSSYFCQYGSGSAIIQTDNPASLTPLVFCGAHIHLVCHMDGIVSEFSGMEVDLNFG